MLRWIRVNNNALRTHCALKQVTRYNCCVDFVSMNYDVWVCYNTKLFVLNLCQEHLEIISSQIWLLSSVSRARLMCNKITYLLYTAIPIHVECYFRVEILLYIKYILAESWRWKTRENWSTSGSFSQHQQRARIVRTWNMLLYVFHVERFPRLYNVYSSFIAFETDSDLFPFT